MKAIHKQFGIVEIKGQNEKNIIISTDSGDKKVMRLFAKNVMTNEDGSNISFDDLPYIQIEEITSTGSSKVKRESKIAAMMANAHDGEEYNIITKDWKKI